MSTERIQCPHCSNPDRDGRPCRWTWWRPWLRDNEAYMAPCEVDRRRADRLRETVNTIAFLAFIVVLVGACWVLAGGLEWTHLHLWMGPALRP